MIMSNVGHRCLLKLGKSAFTHGGLSQNVFKDHQSHAPIRYTSNSTPFDESTKENGGQQSSHTDSSSSSFHQQFHRNAYERKRTNYQKERDRHKNSNQLSSLMTNPSTTHYQRLNIEQEANVSAIKTAYYSLSKIYHPDVVGENNPDAAENFRLITESYDILSDPEARAEYDKSLGPVSQASPENTSWKPSRQQDRDEDYLYRMREAGRIFRSKQDEYFEREKLRNPKKFRAGSFKFEQDFDPRAEADRLNKVINTFRDPYTRPFGEGQQNDASSFYRMHLYDTIQRRREELRNFSHPQESSTDDSAVIISLASVFGLMAILAFAAISTVYNLDFAAYLDSKFEDKISRVESKKD